MLDEYEAESRKGHKTGCVEMAMSRLLRMSGGSDSDDPATGRRASER